MMIELLMLVVKLLLPFVVVELLIPLVIELLLLLVELVFEMVGLVSDWSERSVGRHPFPHYNPLLKHSGFQEVLVSIPSLSSLAHRLWTLGLLTSVMLTAVSPVTVVEGVPISSS